MYFCPNFLDMKRYKILALINPISGVGGKAKMPELIANKLDYKHKNVLELLHKYQSEIEVYGRLAFKKSDGQKLPQGGYAQTKEVAYLNEPQAMLLVCFMQNNPKVRALKSQLVNEFYRMKQLLASQSQTYTPDQIAEIQDKATKKGIAIAHKSMRHPDEELCRDIAQKVFNQYVSELQENYLFIERSKADQMYDVLKWWNDHRKEFGDLRTKARETARELERLSQECDLFSEVYCFTNGKLLDYLKSDPKVED